jgi:hypothetical protein
MPDIFFFFSFGTLWPYHEKRKKKKEKKKPPYGALCWIKPEE